MKYLIKNRREAHKWFAWKPVFCTEGELAVDSYYNGKCYWVWLQYVNRRKTYTDNFIHWI